MPRILRTFGEPVYRVCTVIGAANAIETTEMRGERVTTRVWEPQSQETSRDRSER